MDTVTVIALHAFLSDGLMADPMACGRVRSMAAQIRDPFEQAFFLMVHLPYLQPFEDVNKRVSRLAANIPFIRHNLCPLSFIDVPQQAYVDAMLGVYELNRIELLRDVFVWAYARSCQQYVAVQQNLVRHGEAPTATAVAARVPAAVAENDLRYFVELVLQELKALHPGNAVRFGIGPLELQAWQDKWA